jgi:hypothetical protein
MAKDFTTDPRVENLQPKQKKILIEKLADAEAALVWDDLSAEIAEGRESRRVLPEVLGHDKPRTGGLLGGRREAGIRGLC